SRYSRYSRYFGYSRKFGQTPFEWILHPPHAAARVMRHSQLAHLLYEAAVFAADPSFLLSLAQAGHPRAPDVETHLPIGVRGTPHLQAKCQPFSFHLPGAATNFHSAVAIHSTACVTACIATTTAMTAAAATRQVAQEGPQLPEHV